jgi:catechol 2,3-dioxygenase-like lactoylglutathione lyase family enzyme
LLDPDGNSVEAVHHDTSRQPGSIDHVWIRVADLAASRSFYNSVAPHAGFRLNTETPDRAQFVGEGGTFSLVSGQPTEEAHLAFPVPENETIDIFHSALTSAGHPDNGAPGERLVYHEGYYGAFILDPDGNNVELVNHNRGS